MAGRIFFVLLLFFSFYIAPGKEPIKGSNIKLNSGLTKIQPVSITSITIPKEYQSGGYLSNGERIVFRAPDKELNYNFQLSKYIICNKQGGIIKKFDRVLLWEGGDLILKLNEVSSLLLINLETGFQKIIDINLRDLSNISINTFNRTIIYTLGIQNIIYEYDIDNRRSQTLIKLKNGALLHLFQISPDEIIYIRPEFKIKYYPYEYDPIIRIEVPLFVANVKKYRCVELTKISRSGILFHFDDENRQITFVVEENGYFKIISSNRLWNHKKIKVSHLNRDTRKSYEGLLLHYSSMNSEGNLIVSSRLKLLKKKKYDPDRFQFYILDSEMLIPKAGDIYILDLKGNSKQITETPDQIEVVCDWSPKGNEILYYEYNSKTFYLMELEISDKSKGKPIKISPEKSLKILP